MEDYRKTKEGQRRFNNPIIYRITNIWQSFLWYIGIAWHNSYSNECTKDFNCCTIGIGRKVWLRIKKNRYKKSIEQIWVHNRWSKKFPSGDWCIIGVNKWWASSEYFQIRICFFGFEIRIGVNREFKEV